MEVAEFPGEPTGFPERNRIFFACVGIVLEQPYRVVIRLAAPRCSPLPSCRKRPTIARLAPTPVLQFFGADHWFKQPDHRSRITLPKGANSFVVVVSG